MQNVTNTVAPLQNVALAHQAMQRAINRPQHLPGLVAFYGRSGWGKTKAACYVANKTRAFYVECKSTWTKKALLLAILNEMGQTPAKTIYQMVDQVAEVLMMTRRPLIIDECDHIVERKDIELLRDIYEASNAPILMIGEEQFPMKLQRWERFHNRVLCWQPAQPADLDDARHLANLYVPGTEIADDLLEQVWRTSQQIVRRIAVNLENVRIYAEKKGMKSIDLAGYHGEIYTGEAPVRRVK